MLKMANFGLHFEGEVVVEFFYIFGRDVGYD